MNKETIQELINLQCQKFKNNTAIECGTRAITYDELRCQSNAVARQIINYRIPKETFIGVLIKDRVELIIAAVGVLKAGCVFVPIDTSYPDHRIQVMIHHTDIQYLIGCQSQISRLQANPDFNLNGKNMTCINYMENSLLKNNDTLDLEPETAPRYLPEDKVYIYYTSGTTGDPKAIIGKNKSLLHFIEWEIDTFGINHTFRFSQLTNPGFDVYLRDIFTALCAGSTICIPEDNEVMINGETFLKWLDRREIHLMHIVPSLFRVLNSQPLSIENLKQLKFILFAGEKVIPRELKEWFQTFNDRIQLVNLYGPTETTLAKMFYLILPSDCEREIMPVGKNIRGARVIILNENKKICDTLETGEIYIRTPYRTYGYYNAPELNKEKFIANPFNNDPEDILYKTGDLGRRLPDGNIELLGRIDRQVKIRGMRVELFGIEHIILNHPDINEAVVIKRKVGNHNEFLFAVLTRSIDSGETHKQDMELISQLRAHLLEKLPAYMVPTDMIIVDQLPRKVNGKIDYTEIEKLAENYHTEYVEPADQTERKLREIWSELLDNPSISVTDSFLRVGGNSLSIMSLITKIHQAFDIRIPLGEMFKNTTIRKQASYIREAKKELHRSIEPVEEKKYYVLSSAQKRFYILQQMEPQSTAYNMTQVVKIDGPLEKEKFAHIFKQLIDRHESLRTAFLIIDGKHVQYINQDADIPSKIQYFDLTSRQEEPRTSIHNILENFVKPFNLSSPPLIRIGLIKTGHESHILILDIHHIAADNISLKIFVKEFTALYAGSPLPPLKLQYKNYSEWEYKRIESGEIKRQELYWTDIYKGEIPLLNIPLDFPRGDRPSHEGEWLIVELEEPLRQKIIASTQKEDITMFIFLLAVYYCLLHKYSGQDDIIVGIPISGRIHSELENVIGVFLNTLAIRNFPTAEKTFASFLNEIKRKTLEAFENQDFQFEKLVNKIAIKREAGRNPLFDVVFEFHESIGKEANVSLEGLKVESFDEYSKRKSENDFSLHIFDTKNKIALALQYATSLFKAASAEKITSRFIEVLCQVVDNPTIKLEEISISHDLLIAEPVIKREDQSEFEF